ncbi:cytochrome c oxidase subunit 2 [Granulicella aggregans]|uniref:Cytochrome c oxidase subunit 2 n=1 Tax=Granulicella aggregans TaxID=474949 RepID=A0A7W8E5U3_9BACT|nr:cupredoxin domain-containing protein [Granulicella aggregans]MBB5059674.1 cytochrome c oxidase subunit 2 [Granulicella aggregans]
MLLKRISGYVLLALILCGIVPRRAAAQAGKKIEIVAKRYDFTPGDITVKKGEPVTIVLTSKDVDHGLKFKDFNVSVSAKKGETKEVTFTPDKTGTFVGQCSVFCGSGHGSMKLSLHVTD